MRDNEGVPRRWVTGDSVYGSSRSLRQWLEGQKQPFVLAVRSNESELSFHRVVRKNYPHLFPDLISRSRYHRRRKDLMGIQREMLRLLMNRLRLLAIWLALDSAPITTAESPRWKSAGMPIWAAEAGFSPSKQQFFLGFRLHLLVSNKGAICDFVLSPANVGERRAQGHLLAVEAKWQALRSAFLAKARPVLAVGGHCGNWLASRVSSRRSLASSRLKKPELGPFGA